MNKPKVWSVKIKESEPDCDTCGVMHFSHIDLTSEGFTQVIEKSAYDKAVDTLRWVIEYGSPDRPGLVEKMKNTLKELRETDE